MIANRVHQTTNTPQENEFCVIIKLKSQAHNLRITYSKQVGGRLTQIEEIDALETVISSSKFRGSSCSGFCSDDIKQIKPLLGSISPTEWVRDNQDLVIDVHYRIY